MGSLEDLIRWFDAVKAAHPGLRVVGTSAKADTDIACADFAQPTILVLGNETRGMSWNLQQACDLTVRIPIHGAASSLNLACAASIVLYEVDRLRRMRQL